jgi:hypothetical protein
LGFIKVRGKNPFCGCRLQQTAESSLDIPNTVE